MQVHPEKNESSSDDVATTATVGATMPSHLPPLKVKSFQILPVQSNTIAGTPRVQNKAGVVLDSLASKKSNLGFNEDTVGSRLIHSTTTDSNSTDSTTDFAPSSQIQPNPAPNPITLDYKKKRKEAILEKKRKKMLKKKKKKERKYRLVRKRRKKRKTIKNTPKKIFGAIIMGSIAGCALVTQNGVNTSLKDEVVGSPWLAALFSFTVGCMFVYMMATIRTPEWNDFRPRLKTTPWICFTGGFLGPVYVVSAVYLTKILSFSTYQNCAVLGMIMSSSFCDSVGLLGIPKKSPTRSRMVWLFGFALVILFSIIREALLDKKKNVTPFYYFLYCFLAIIAGSVFPLQACVNAALRVHIGTPYRAAFVSFGCGVMVLSLLSVVSIVFFPLSSIGENSVDIYILKSEPWMYVGGLCGGVVVTLNIIGVTRFGVAAYTAAFVAAQLIFAFLYDLFGAFMVSRTTPTIFEWVQFVFIFGLSILYQTAPVSYEAEDKTAKSVSVIPPQVAQHDDSSELAIAPIDTIDDNSIFQASGWAQQEGDTLVDEGFASESESYATMESYMSSESESESDTEEFKRDGV